MTARDPRAELQEKILALTEMEETLGWRILRQHLQGLITATLDRIVDTAPGCCEYRLLAGKVQAWREVLGLREMWEDRAQEMERWQS